MWHGEDEFFSSLDLPVVAVSNRAISSIGMNILDTVDTLHS
jgi:hypothetical protein